LRVAVDFASLSIGPKHINGDRFLTGAALIVLSHYDGNLVLHRVL